MNKIIAITLFFILTGCSEQDATLNQAIAASREGLALIADSKFDEGRELLTKAKSHYASLIADAPQNGLYNNNYGWVLMKLGEYEEAEKYLRIALKNQNSISPESAPEKNLEELLRLKSKQK